MIDFKEELAKYKPVKLINDVDSNDDIQDIMDLLQHLSSKTLRKPKKDEGST